MKTVREALKAIKEMQGIKTDAELADNLEVSVHTMRNWIQKNSIRIKLLEYCFNNHISIDEIFFGEPLFCKDRCGKCKKKSLCSVYGEKQLIPVSIKQVQEELHVTIDTKEYKLFSCRVQYKQNSISNFSTQIKNADKISILLT